LTFPRGRLWSCRFLSRLEGIREDSVFRPFNRNGLESLQAGNRAYGLAVQTEAKRPTGRGESRGDSDERAAARGVGSDDSGAGTRPTGAGRATGWARRSWGSRPASHQQTAAAHRKGGHGGKGKCKTL